MDSEIPKTIRWFGEELTFVKVLETDLKVAEYRYPAGHSTFFFVAHARKIAKREFPPELRVPDGL